MFAAFVHECVCGTRTLIGVAETVEGDADEIEKWHATLGQVASELELRYVPATQEQFQCPACGRRRSIATC